MKAYVKLYIKEVIIVLLQLFLFYIFPVFAGPTDMMGMVFLILLATFVLGTAVGGLSKAPVKYLYPLFVSVAFVPTVPIYYNETAMVHAVWYLVVSLVGLLLGLIVRVVVRLMEGESIRPGAQAMKKAGKAICIMAAVAAIGYVLWMFGFLRVKSLDNIPSLTLIEQEGEAFGHKKLQGYQRDQLIEIWGEPTVAVHENEDLWYVDEDTAVRINYNNLGEVVMVGVIEI